MNDNVGANKRYNYRTKKKNKAPYGPSRNETVYGRGSFQESICSLVSMLLYLQVILDAF